MLKNTTAVFHIIVKDLKLASRCLTIFTNLLYIAFLCISLAFGFGILPLNIVMMTLTVSGFLFYLIVDFTDNKVLDDSYEKASPWIRYIKLAVNLISLSISIYGMVFITSYTAPVYMQVITVINVIFWLIRVIVEVVLAYVKSRWKLLVGGLVMDFKPVLSAYRGYKKAKSAVGNMVDRFLGREEQEPLDDENLWFDISEKTEATIRNQRRKDEEAKSNK